MSSGNLNVKNLLAFLTKCSNYSDFQVKRIYLAPFRTEIMVLITWATSEGSGEPAHPGSLARAFAVSKHEVWKSTKSPTKNQTFSPIGWLCMRIWRMSLQKMKSAIISRDGSIFFFFGYNDNPKSEDRQVLDKQRRLCKSRPIRVYTACHFVCIFWTQYGMEKIGRIKFEDNYSYFLGFTIFFQIFTVFPGLAVSMSLIMRKLVFRVSHQGWQKPACLAMEAS